MDSGINALSVICRMISPDDLVICDSRMTRIKESGRRATTALYRKLVSRARKITRSGGFKSRLIDLMLRDANLWAAVCVKHDGSITTAMEQDELFEGRRPDDLSKSLAPFNSALNMEFKRGPRVTERLKGLFSNVKHPLTRVAPTETSSWIDSSKPKK